MTRTLQSLFLSGIILLQSCQFTTTMPNDPEFKDHNDAVTNYLVSNTNCNDIRIEGSRINSTDEGKRSELTIKLNYSTEVPDEAKRQKIAFDVARQLKQSLKNANQFDAFRVSFVRVQKDGLVTTTKTQSILFASVEL